MIRPTRSTVKKEIRSLHLHHPVNEDVSLATFHPVHHGLRVGAWAMTQLQCNHQCLASQRPRASSMLA